MSARAITPEQFIENIKTEMDNLDNFFIRYHLKKLGFRHIKKVTLERVKACYFLDKHGFWITVNLMTALVERSSASTSMALHNLGDKNIINLHGYDGKQLAWKFSPELKNIIEGKPKEDSD